MSDYPAAGYVLRDKFSQIHPTTGMSFAVIPHPSSTLPTKLPELLKKWSSMPAALADDRSSIKPNHIYVIPPGKEIRVEDGSFDVRPKSKVKGWSNVITLFINSLAEWRKPAGIVVILSGMDADGTAALEGFHQQGGITIVQELEAAAHPDMPRAAIETGYVDYIQPPHRIAAKIEEIAEETFD
ncbi:MAG TPA: chemotaxis protein CheB [Terriglobia bacterium]|nr:chemotaxis protein CheB [Terriglobia bacterium]